MSAATKERTEMRKSMFALQGRPDQGLLRTRRLSHQRRGCPYSASPGSTWAATASESSAVRSSARWQPTPTSCCW